MVNQESWIELTPEQIAHAEHLAQQRFANAKKKKLEDTIGMDSLESHRLGALGECAAAVYRGNPLPVFAEDFGKADLPGGVCVRTTSKWHYRLLVRPKDDDDLKCLLVTKVGSRYAIRGWLPALEAKRIPLSDPGGMGAAHFVPAIMLRNPLELK